MNTDERTKEIFAKIEEQLKGVTQEHKIAVSNMKNLTNFFQPVEMFRSELYGMEFSVTLNENGSITISPMKRNDVASKSVYEKIKEL